LSGTSTRQGVEHVHRTIREAILDGRLPPGTTMSQVMLADELGVSRTPLREALRMLQNEGLVHSELNRRVRVSELSLSDLEQIYAIRLPLEAAALRLSLPGMTPEHLAHLEGHMAEMAHFAEERDYTRWYIPHRAYHEALIAGAGKRVRDLLAELFDHAERYRRFHMGRSFSDRTQAEHRAILDAVKAGEANAAAARLTEHLSRSAITVIEILDPNYEALALSQALADISASLGLELALTRERAAEPARRGARPRR
jgi:DNA-binding GntR family transcriptional regulator